MIRPRRRHGVGGGSALCCVRRTVHVFRASLAVNVGGSMPHIIGEYSANLEDRLDGISNAFFLYTRDPDGHRVELFTSDYLTVDPDLKPLRWSLRDPQRQTLWGHPAPRSWFEEGSMFVDVPLREPALEAQPIVAR
jgi:hypothetical protein